MTIHPTPWETATGLCNERQHIMAEVSTDGTTYAHKQECTRCGEFLATSRAGRVYGTALHLNCDGGTDE